MTNATKKRTLIIALALLTFALLVVGFPRILGVLGSHRVLDQGNITVYNPDTLTPIFSTQGNSSFYHITDPQNNSTLSLYNTASGASSQLLYPEPYPVEPIVVNGNLDNLPSQAFGGIPYEPRFKLGLTDMRAVDARRSDQGGTLRFLSQDPLGLSAGVNQFQYATGLGVNAVTHVDPWGLFDWVGAGMSSSAYGQLAVDRYDQSVVADTVGAVSDVGSDLVAMSRLPGQIMAGEVDLQEVAVNVLGQAFFEMQQRQENFENDGHGAFGAVTLGSAATMSSMLAGNQILNIWEGEDAQGNRLNRRDRIREGLTAGINLGLLFVPEGGSGRASQASRVVSRDIPLHILNPDVTLPRIQNVGKVISNAGERLLNGSLPDGTPVVLINHDFGSMSLEMALRSQRILSRLEAQAPGLFAKGFGIWTDDGGRVFLAVERLSGATHQSHGIPLRNWFDSIGFEQVANALEVGPSDARQLMDYAFRQSDDTVRIRPDLARNEFGRFLGGFKNAHPGFFELGAGLAATSVLALQANGSTPNDALELHISQPGDTSQLDPVIPVVTVTATATSTASRTPTALASFTATVTPIATSTFTPIATATIPACVPSWTCSGWTCVGGLEARSCWDTNSCGTSAGMPATTGQSCSEPPPPPPPPPPVATSTSTATATATRTATRTLTKTPTRTPTRTPTPNGTPEPPANLTAIAKTAPGKAYIQIKFDTPSLPPGQTVMKCQLKRGTVDDVNAAGYLNLTGTSIAWFDCAPNSNMAQDDGTGVGGTRYYYWARVDAGPLSGWSNSGNAIYPSLAATPTPTRTATRTSTRTVTNTPTPSIVQLNAPTGVNASPDSTAAIDFTINFSLSSGANYYQLGYKSDSTAPCPNPNSTFYSKSGWFTRAQVLNGSLGRFTHTNQANQRFCFAVQASTDAFGNNVSAWSAPDDAYRYLMAPQLVSISNASGGTCNVTARQITWNNSSEAVTYRIYFSGPNNSTNPPFEYYTGHVFAQSGTTTSLTLPSMVCPTTSGTFTYTVAVRAFAGSGSSNYSNFKTFNDTKPPSSSGGSGGGGIIAICPSGEC